MNRDDAQAALTAGDTFDLLVVGGGATGLGTAVDAASRGHRVALVEAHDFAKGTSSRSTKLVHGGVRYLKQGNVPLVMEALKERGLLARNAPELVRDLKFVIPAYSPFDRAFYGVGLKVYDALAAGRGLGASRVLGRRATEDFLPTVRKSGLRGGVLYHDGQFDDARLAVALARTAVDEGAVLANYVRAVSLMKESGRVVGAELRDEESGKEFAVRARVVVNATGVFVDELRQADESAAEPMLAVSQGVHLVLPKRFLPGEAALMVPKTKDGRVLFAVPWHDRVVLGTTDTPVAGPSIEPRALDEERSFLMDHARLFLEEAPRVEDVLSIFAGQRPLVKSNATASTAALSRDHSLVVSASGLLTVTGGKWTTYRKMGQDVVDRAEQLAGLDPRACRTETLRLCAAEADGAGEAIDPALPLTAGEVDRFAKDEMARTLEDVLARRSRWLLLDARASIEAAPVVAAMLARALGRDEAWARSQVEAYRELAAGYVFSA